MKICVKNLGCKVNNYECEYIREQFLEKGYTYSEDADIFVVNTCTVTNTSDAKSRKVIRRIRREFPDAVLVVMGCFSENKKDDIENIIDADIIIGNVNKSKVVDLTEEYLKNRKENISFESMDTRVFEDMEIKKFETKTRAFIKIQDGCNNFCSYCIIPYVRGNTRSKSKDMVLREVNNLIRTGHKEIVLTGIHTGQYGSEFSNYKLVDLIKDISKTEVERIRISSIEITELDEVMLNEFKSNNKLVNHFHIPLQSGNDKTLSEMNRKYDTEYFLDKVNQIRNIDGDVSLTTDVIVGFPGETDGDFINTLNFIKKAKFTNIHVFPYSDRDGTVASRRDDKVSDYEKKDRVKELIKLSKELEIGYLKKFVGRELEIIVETNKDNRSVGHTTNYIKVVLEEKLGVNEIVKVKITELKDGYMEAKSLTYIGN